jgi:dehydrogenase/reductase SDR family protein 1
MALSGRICLVTGASKGIGRGIAVQLGQAGATVYITGRSVDKLQSCADEIKSRGGKVCIKGIIIHQSFFT